MHIYKELLESQGIPGASATSISTALNLLYSSIAEMEPEQRSIFFDINCSAVDAAEEFAAHENLSCCNETLSQDMIIMFSPDFKVDDLKTKPTCNNVLNMEDYRDN